MENQNLHIPQISSLLFDDGNEKLVKLLVFQKFHQTISTKKNTNVVASYYIVPIDADQDYTCQKPVEKLEISISNT